MRLRCCVDVGLQKHPEAAINSIIVVLEASNALRKSILGLHIFDTYTFDIFGGKSRTTFRDR